MAKLKIWPARHRRIGEQVPRLASKWERPKAPRTNLVPTTKSTKSVKVLREIVLMKTGNPEKILTRLNTKYGAGKYSISTVNNAIERLGEMGFLYAEETEGHRTIKPTLKAKLQLLKAERMLANVTLSAENRQRLESLKTDMQKLRMELKRTESEKNNLRIRNIDE